MTTPRSYDPRLFKMLTFHDAAANFKKGSDTPRAYLERCLDAIAKQEPAIKAFVVLAPGVEYGEREVIKHCLARLESYMAPKQVVFVASLPKTESGKITKNGLA